MRRICFERAKSIAGVGLVAVGAFIWFEHLHRAAAGLGHVFGIPDGALGMVPAVIFAASRMVRAYAADQQRFLQDFIEQVAISAWPLVLVMLGAELSRDDVGDEGDSLSKKECKDVDLTGGRSTLK
ncbi:MAG: hypothetical protein ACYDDS_14685 [Candidatus Sulfotelmatobacter sp.]|jgi:hypothetical protein